MDLDNRRASLTLKEKNPCPCGVIHNLHWTWAYRNDIGNEEVFNQCIYRSINYDLSLQWNMMLNLYNGMVHGRCTKNKTIANGRKIWILLHWNGCCCWCCCLVMVGNICVVSDKNRRWNTHTQLQMFPLNGNVASTKCHNNLRNRFVCYVMAGHKQMYMCICCVVGHLFVVWDSQTDITYSPLINLSDKLFKTNLFSFCWVQIDSMVSSCVSIEI